MLTSSERRGTPWTGRRPITGLETKLVMTYMILPISGLCLLRAETLLLPARSLIFTATLWKRPRNTIRNSPNYSWKKTSARMSSNVRRCLFGPVDHEQLQRDFKLKLREISVEDSRRWNFNFQADTPLPGMFEWEPVNCTADFYQESSQMKDSRMQVQTEESSNSSSNQENCLSFSNKRPAEVTPVRRKRSLSKMVGKPRDNAPITDFFVKRRRTTESKRSNFFKSSKTIR
ncbi:cyclin-dependent kinase inhibitor 1Ca [Dunckerocampus dactyliophorus]|uniref:cyclin-dependent kinase inhibitor 1Ca n=1 Tax=Dunckerocampus dactyliophorus TaxID=161453 RepID=UPI002406592D|nr:cyclin-dependent kinase inhibitor 1Ca [Dunckerocampus dactyliophorus]